MRPASTQVVLSSTASLAYSRPCTELQRFWQAIKRHARIGKPIIITETGIADGVDTRRELWATSYLKAVSVEAPLEGLAQHGKHYYSIHYSAAFHRASHHRKLRCAKSLHTAIQMSDGCG